MRRILRIKLRAGLFDRPYADQARERSAMLTGAFRAKAREIAARSMVLLRNQTACCRSIPRSPGVAVIGPLADDRAEMLGNWTGDGRPR